MLKRIAVIGAGASGLTATKCCLEEEFEVVCFEKSDSIGGLWRYREDDLEGFGSVMKSTIINTNKELNAFSDFPPPREFPMFVHNSLMLRYIELYAETFNLLPHVKFNHEILKAEPAQDFDETGRWLVTFRNVRNDNSIERELFDGVMVCTGHHVTPHMPKFPGQEKFKGTIMHSHSYKKPKGFDDNMKIVVVGVGNSGADVAVELSAVCKQVYLSTRRGCWVVARQSTNGLPFDMLMVRRFYALAQKYLPSWLCSWFVERHANDRIDHSIYNLKPKHRFCDQHPTVNDSLASRIMNGTILVKPNIDRFTSSGVIFDGEDEEHQVNAVVMATGYRIAFPFLGKDVFNAQNNHVELYKFIFHPYLQHQTIGFIGLPQVIGSIFPVSEAQSRLFALVMKNKVKLPSKEHMIESVKRVNIENAKRYYNSPRHTVQADWLKYMDEIALLSGTKPDLLKMAFTNPRLFFACVFGPGCSYQYRLTGPHQWEGAEDAILNLYDRMIAGVKAKKPAIEMNYTSQGQSNGKKNKVKRH